ncbi:MAG: phosphoribosylformylglycinamidine synthase subunit PurL [bacterium]
MAGLGLLLENEYKLLKKLIGREPTPVEETIFSIMWSEHCSYKSSRKVLKLLPTSASNVVLGPGEDSGIVYFAGEGKDAWCVVIAHESHNHPSQVLPIEGAATGIGGIVRDVYCMGAKVVAVMDPLRFGDPYGEKSNRVRYIINGVVKGIADYGNPIGVPNLGGDVYFHSGFDDNCLVNVVAVGIVRKRNIVHSAVPEQAKSVPYKFILVGKATDDTGFGGATFASELLNEEEEKKGAVQVHDPFLKRVITVATFKVLEEAERKGIVLGFKDLGAGGLACATSELSAKGGFGADIYLDRVPISIKNLKPEIIACAETQERYVLVVPESFTKRVIDIYNVEYELGKVYPGAGASVIGEPREDGLYRVHYKGEIVCSVLAKTITEGIHYERKRKERHRQVFNEGRKISIEGAIKKVLGHLDVCNREPIYSHYDSTIQGNTILLTGYGEAGVIKPIDEIDTCLAMTVDGNPRLGEIDPYWAGANAIYEAMRNIVSVGAVPICITDCLNFGSPEDPEVFDDFYKVVEGISYACKSIGRLDAEGEPLPIVSGNVSFYNENAEGKPIPPSPIVACLGRIENYDSIIKSRIDTANVDLIFIYDTENIKKLGGSVYNTIIEAKGGEVPHFDGRYARLMLNLILTLQREGLILACKDISDGGLITSLFEMIYNNDNNLGVKIDLTDIPIGNELALFSEAGGFVIGVKKNNIEETLIRAKEDCISAVHIGEVDNSGIFNINRDGKNIVKLNMEELKKLYNEPLKEIFSWQVE